MISKKIVQYSITHAPYIYMSKQYKITLRHPYSSSAFEWYQEHNGVTMVLGVLKGTNKQNKLPYLINKYSYSPSISLSPLLSLHFSWYLHFYWGSPFHSPFDCTSSSLNCTFKFVNNISIVVVRVCAWWPITKWHFWMNMQDLFL
jgi:hypothetical protein